MKDILLKTAIFLKLVDAHDTKTLSLTNAALLIVVAKLAIAPVVSITDVGTLFVTLLAYSGKKALNNQQKNQEAIPVDTTALETTIGSAVQEIETLKSRVSTMALSVGLKAKQ